MEPLIPRHVQIILEINRRFMSSVKPRFAGNPDGLNRVSIVQENGEKRLRMANLAIVGSHKVNGVAALHTELLKTRVVKDFAELWPEKIRAHHQRSTPRRWLLACNPRLAAAISGRIGNSWPRELDRLSELNQLAGDDAFQDEVMAVKQANKQALAVTVHGLTGVKLAPDSLFDVQIKRLHEYKRQLLNIMHVILLYHRLKADPTADVLPRSFIFGAKADRRPTTWPSSSSGSSPGSPMSSTTTSKSMGGSGSCSCPTTGSRWPRRSSRRPISRNRSRPPGMEASGTGNMKLALNGALTIGTLDGANIEMLDRIGIDNMFIFGLTADEVAENLSSGEYNPWHVYEADPDSPP